MKSKPSRPYENQVIARQMRDNVDATDLLALDIYDPAFKKRQELWTPAGWKLYVLMWKWLHLSILFMIYAVQIVNS